MIRRGAGVALAILLLTWCIVSAPNYGTRSMGVLQLIVNTFPVLLWAFSVVVIAYVALYKAAAGHRTRRADIELRLITVGAFSGAWLTTAAPMVLEVYHRIAIGGVTQAHKLTWLFVPPIAAAVAGLGGVLGLIGALLVKILWREWYTRRDD